MKPVFSTLLAGLVVACATAENQTPLGGGDDIAGTAGTDTAGTSAATSGSSSGGSSSGGSSSGGNATGGTPPATGGQPTAGTQSTGGMINAAGTGFLPGGTSSGGTGGSGTGGTTTGGTAAGGTGGKAAGGTGGTGGKATGGTGGTSTAGTGGTGGTGNPVGCGPKTGWTATAMPDASAANCDTPDDTDPYCAPPIRGIDGVTNNRYSSVAARTGNEWYQIDFGHSVTVTQVVLNTAAGSSDYTLSYEVKMAATEAALAAAPVITMGPGMMGATTITFPTAQTGQFLRIYQKTAMAGWWSLAEVDVTCN